MLLVDGPYAAMLIGQIGIRPPAKAGTLTPHVARLSDAVLARRIHIIDIISDARRLAAVAVVPPS